MTSGTESIRIFGISFRGNRIDAVAAWPAGLGFGAILPLLAFMPALVPPFFGALPAGLGFGAVLPLLAFMPGFPSLFFGARLPFMEATPTRLARCRTRDCAALQLAGRCSAMAK